MTHFCTHGYSYDVTRASKRYSAARVPRTRIRARVSAMDMMEDFLDDIGAEVEMNPDEVEIVKKKKPKKTRLLKRMKRKRYWTC